MNVHKHVDNEVSKSENENSDLTQKPVLPHKNVEFKSILMIVGVLLLVILLAEGVMLYGFKLENNKVVKAIGSVLPYPMAMVEYKPIYLSKYWGELDLIVKTCQEAKVGTDCQITDKDRSDVYTNLINEQVVLKLAKLNNISLADGKLDEEMKKISDQNGGDAEFAKLLQEKFGWSVDEFKQRVYLSLLAQEMEDKMVEKVNAKHLLIMADKNAKPEDIEKAKQKAQEALDKINKGEDFDAIVKEYSEDTSTKDSGGDLGFFARGVMVPEFEQAAFSLARGQVSGLIKTDFGWHIIKVIDKKGEIKQDFKSWLEEQKSKMRIWEFYKVV